MYPRSLFVTLITAGALSGCATGPNQTASSVTMPAQFYGERVNASNVPGPQTQMTAWWTRYGDPLLDQYVALGLQQNLDLAQASARVNQARAGLGAATAALLPSGAMAGQAAKGTQSLQTPLGQVLSANPAFDRDGESYELNMAASWEIDLSGGLRRSREAVRADYEASEAAVSATRLSITSAIVDTYIVIRGLQERIEIADRQLQTRRSLLDMIEKLHSQGLVPELQVRQTAAAVAEAEARIPALESAKETAIHALDILLGTPAGTHLAELSQSAPVPTVEQIAPSGTPGDLLRRRPDLIVAERQLAAAHARKGVAVAEYYPKFSLSGLLGGATSVSSGELFSDGARQSAGILGLRWRAFDFARIDAQIKQAGGQDAEALAAYRLAALRATEDVENAYSAYDRQFTQYKALSAGVTDLELARASADTAYKTGAVSLLDVLYADEAILRASDARSQARTEAARASLAVFKALGGDI